MQDMKHYHNIKYDSPYYEIAEDPRYLFITISFFAQANFFPERVRMYVLYDSVTKDLKCYKIDHSLDSGITPFFKPKINIEELFGWEQPIEPESSFMTDIPIHYIFIRSNNRQRELGFDYFDLKDKSKTGPFKKILQLYEYNFPDYDFINKPFILTILSKWCLVPICKLLRKTHNKRISFKMNGFIEEIESTYEAVMNARKMHREQYEKNS